MHGWKKKSHEKLENIYNWMIIEVQHIKSVRCSEAVLRRNCIALNNSIRKEERPQIDVP